MILYQVVMESTGRCMGRSCSESVTKKGWFGFIKRADDVLKAHTIMPERNSCKVIGRLRTV